MSRVCKSHFARGKFDNRGKQRDKHIGFVAGAKFVVCVAHDVGKIFGLAAGQNVVLEQSFCHNHEKRGRNAFIRNVSDCYHEMIFVEKIKIVKISADSFCGRHRGMKIEFIADGEIFRQHSVLNFCCDGKFCFGSFFGGGDARQVRHIIFQFAGHVIEVFGERFDFVARVNVQLFIEVAARNFLHAVN